MSLCKLETTKAPGMVWRAGGGLSIGTLSRRNVLISAVVSQKAAGRWSLHVLERRGKARSNYLHNSDRHETREAAMRRADELAREALRIKVKV